MLNPAVEPLCQHLLVSFMLLMCLLLVYNLLDPHKIMASSATEWNVNRYCIAVIETSKNLMSMVKFLVAYLFVKPLLTVSVTFLVGIKNDIFLSLLHLTNSFSTDIKLWNEYGCFAYMCLVTDLKIWCCRDNTCIKKLWKKYSSVDYFVSLHFSHLFSPQISCIFHYSGILCRSWIIVFS